MLLIGALGQYRTLLVAGVSSVSAAAGAIVLADPSGGSPTVDAPLAPAVGAWFGVADATASSGTHAINIVSVGSLLMLESPASAGSFSNAVTIATNGRVRFWLYTATNWKLIYGVF